MSHSTIVAEVDLQILGKDNNTVRSSRNIKLAEISSVKDDNDTKDEQVIFIRISPMKGAKSNIGPVGYPVIEMTLYDKFVKNGIATIKLSKSSVQILISNCPPRDLALFLTTLKIKLGSSAATVKDLMRTNSIEKLRPQSITTLDAISPVRRADALKMQQKELAVHFLAGEKRPITPVRQKRPIDANYKFLFQSNVWETAFKQTYFLTEVKRQSDKQFIDLLSEIRLGECSEKTKKILESTSNQKIAVDGIIPTKLCCYKDDVMKKNSASLESLKGDPVEYIAEDSVSGKDYYISQVCAAEQKVTLKIGAQVMLLKNIDVQEGLANGSRGVVVKFETSAGQLFPAVRFVGGKTVTIKPEIFSVSISIGGNLSVVVRRQIPLKLAYAITVHKSQGMTLDCVDLDVSNTFESGQAYVALSRCKSLQTMRVINWNRHCVRVDKAVKEFYEKQQDNADWP